MWLFDALAEVVTASQIGSWLDTPNPAFEASTPIEVIERGQSDRIWRMWELRGGNSGDLRSWAALRAEEWKKTELSSSRVGRS